MPTRRRPPPAPEPPFARARSVECERLALKLRLGSFAVDNVHWGFIEPSPWRNWLHAHSYYEICYAFAGRGVFRMEGVEHPLRAGDVFIAKPREEHEIIADRRDPLGIYFWSYTLVADAAGGKPDDPVDRLLHAFADARRCVSDRVPGMERTLELLTEEVVRAEPGYTAVAEGLFRKLVLDTARAAVEAPQPGERPPARPARDPDGVVEAAKRYVRDNLARALTVRDLAAQVGVGERHFTRLFRRAAGVSPMDFVIDARVEAAEQLLLDPALPIKEVALRVGYPDVRYFTTVFRRRTGYPPATWRLGRGTRLAAKASAVRGTGGAVRQLQRLRRTMDARAARNRAKGAGRQVRKTNKRGPSAK